MTYKWYVFTYLYKVFLTLHIRVTFKCVMSEYHV